MKRMIIWILGGIAVLAVAAVILISRVDTDFVVRQIADATAKATGQPLQFDTPPGISFFPPGVHFGQAHWGNADEAQGVSIAVKGGMAQLELSPLLAGNVVVREIRLDSPVVEIREGKSVAPPETTPEPPKAETPKPNASKPGSSKPGAAKNAPSKAETAPADQPAPAAKTALEPPALPIELKRLVLRQGSITYTGAAGQILRINDVNLSVENLRIGQEATVQCDFSFALGNSQSDAAKEANNLSGTLAFTSRLRYAPPQLLFRQTALTVTPLTGALPKEAGPLQLTCEGTLRLTDLHLQLTRAILGTPQARMTISGEASLSVPTFNGSLEIEGSPQKMAALAGHTIKPAPGKDELRFRTMLRYVPNAMNLSQMQLQTDDISLRGGLRFEFPADAPLGITADIQAGAINLTPYLSAAETPPASGKAHDAKATSSEAETAPAKKAAKPDPAAAQKMPALDIRAKVASISKGGLQAKDIFLAIKGEKGRYALTSLAATLGSGGSIKATGSVNMANETCAIKANAADVDLGPLLVALGKKRTVDGLAMLETDLTMNCGGAAEVRQSLAGRGQVEIRQLHVPAMAELGKSLPMLAGKGGPLPDTFDLTRAPFTAKDGEINAAPITVASPSLNAAGKARISLPRQHIDAAMDIKTLGLTIPVTAKGPLSDISYGVDPKFALDMAKKLPGALLDTGKQAGGVTKDATKGAGGLLRGILGR
ncbi:AsmA family protein [Desulfovibrio sp.]|uniref:AsmA family protein n=1 Tax=Desulfovibrio sp. TaxID=885 RepID=UPI0035B3C69F